MKKNVMSVFKPLRAVFIKAELPGHGEDTGLDLDRESLEASLSSLDANDKKQQYQRLADNFASQLKGANPDIAKKYQDRFQVLKDNVASANITYSDALSDLIRTVSSFNVEMPEQETTVAEKPKKAPSHQKEMTFGMEDAVDTGSSEMTFGMEDAVDTGEKPTEQEIQSIVLNSKVSKAMAADAKEYKDNPEMKELRRSIAETMAQGMDAVRDGINNLVFLADTMDELLVSYNERKAGILVSRDAYVTRADEHGRPISAASDRLSKETFYEDEGAEITGDSSSNEGLASFGDDLDNDQSLN